jgi:hypothetical protein
MTPNQLFFAVGGLMITLFGMAMGFRKTTSTPSLNP